MSTAKPDETSGQPEGSDDLIAELARMMAQDAKTDRPEVPQSAPAASNSPSQAAEPARPAAAEPRPSAPAAPIVRIPGAEQQVPQSGQKFDFGRPPAPVPVINPEPLANWQERRNVRQDPAGSGASERREPTMATAAPRPPQAPAAGPAHQGGVPAVTPQSSRSDVDLDFDFGPREDRGREETPQSGREAKLEPRPFTLPSGQAQLGTSRPVEVPAKATPVQSVDAIADLIAADFDGGEGHNGPGPQPAQAQVEPQIAPVPAPEAPKAPGQSAEQDRPLTRPVNLTPQPKAGDDRFALSPVFGVPRNPAAPAKADAGRPADGKPPVSPARDSQPAPVVAAPNGPAKDKAPVAGARDEPSDPFREIENLIGGAARRDTNISPRPAVAPAAAEASHAAPALTSWRDRVNKPRIEEPQGSADDAILAAAAATGADVGHVTEFADEDRQAARRKVPAMHIASRNRLKTIVVPAVAGTLLLAAGFGVYWAMGTGSTDGTAPVLTADTTPVKQAPETPAELADDAQRSVVFDEIDGVETRTEAEQLVSRDQADVAEATQIVAPAAEEMGLANRKVRTVTVRPDGTIVSSGDEALAGSTELPVDRPNVPELPASGVDASDLLDNANGALAANPTPALSGTPAPSVAATTAIGTPATPAGAATGQPQTTTAAAGAVPGAGLGAPDAAATATPSTTVAPVPRPRPNREALASRPTSAVNAVIPGSTPAGQPNDLIGNLAAQSAVEAQAPQQQSAAATPATTAAEPAAAPAYVQLSSQRSEADARQTLEAVQSRFGNLFGGAQLQIRRIDLADRGVFYRVLLPASSLQSASEICATVKANGGDCFALN